MMTVLSVNFSTRGYLGELYRKLCQRLSVRQEWRSVGARADRLTHTNRYRLGNLESAVAIMAKIAHPCGKVAGRCAERVRSPGARANRAAVML
jgi:hypothetical protein